VGAAVRVEPSTLDAAAVQLERAAAVARTARPRTWAGHDGAYGFASVVDAMQAASDVGAALAEDVVDALETGSDALRATAAAYRASDERARLLLATILELMDGPL